MTEQFGSYQFLQIISRCLAQNIFVASKRTTFETVYVLVFTAAIVVMYLMILLWRLNVPMNFTTNLYNLTFVVLFLCNSTSLYTLNFSRRTGLCRVFKNINSIYRDLTEQLSGFKIQEEKQYNVYLIGIHILFLLNSILHYFTYSNLNFAVYAATPIIIFSYLVVLAVFQYTCVVFIIKNVVDSLNKQIHENATTINIGNIGNHTSTISKVKFLLKLYDKVFDLANDVNKIFGLALLGVYLILLVSLIRSVALAVHFGIFNWCGAEVYSMTNWTDCLMWLMLAHLLSAACAKAKYSLRNGSLLAYEAVAHISLNQDCGDEDDFVLLAYSLTNRPFAFTVCGLYEIDYSLLFAMIGSIAYYVVILIQLQ